MLTPAATWTQYGLQTAFKEIERLHHEVTDAGNPISMNLKTRYVVKGIGAEQTIESVVKIFTNAQGKIEKVEDKWGGKLPDNAFQNVSRPLRRSPSRSSLLRFPRAPRGSALIRGV